MKKIILLGAVLTGIAPSLAFADVPAVSDGTVFGILSVINSILSWIIPVLITLAAVYFIWGVVQYTINSSDEEAKKAGRAKIINGLIGLFVILAFWGIVYLVMNTFSIGGQQLNPLDIPCVEGPGVDCF